MRSPHTRVLLLAGVVLAGIRTTLTTTLDLFGDEAWYWWEGQHLALAYSDLPGATQAAIRLATGLFGDSAVFVRLPFLVASTLIPVVIYHWTRARVDAPSARLAAWFAMLLPMSLGVGLLAIPDALLTLIGILAVYSFDRAVRRDHIRAWGLTGLLVGAGFFVHYRFAIVPLSLLIYLVTSKTGRRCFSRPGLWLAGLFALPGLAPIIGYNLANDLTGFRFQFVDRHPWTYHADGWWFWVRQLSVTTPLLYGALLATGWLGIVRRRHNDTHFLAAIVCLTHVFVYGLAAPFMDQQRTSIHWPLLGYIIALPWVLSTFNWYFGRWQRAATVATTALIVTGAAATLGYAALAASYATLPHSLQLLVSSKTAGHAAFAAAVADTLEDLPEGTGVLVDDLYPASHLRFYLSGHHDQARIRVLDEDKAARDNRLPQLREWDRIEQRPLDLPFLFVINKQAWSQDEYRQHFERLCAKHPNVTLARQRSRFHSEHIDQVWRIDPTSLSAPPLEACRPAPRIYVDDGYPTAGDVIDTLSLRGWAYADDAGGVTAVELTVDGDVIARAEYGSSRPDVAAFFTDSTDPNHPQVGFTLDFNAADIPSGGARSGELALRVATANGRVDSFLETWVTLKP
jgi:4-amino-4-deoxy-L-arabinose transferase-like glycosyltransferase